MKRLKPLNQMHYGPPEPLGNVPGRLSSFVQFWELLRNLFLTQSVVLKLLGCLLAIHNGCEDIVQTKLPWKHVHHDVHGALIMPILDHRGALIGKAVQNI
jgi:hypothetical protein